MHSNLINPHWWPDFVAALQGDGLNLVGSLEVAALPVELLGSDALSDDLQSLLVVGHAGRGFWEGFVPNRPDSSDPVDDYSVARVLAHLPESIRAGSRILYPGDGQVALQRLGRLLGWHADSLLGVGIHPLWGTWYAYRAVLAVPVRLAESRSSPPQSACGECPGRACIAACPARAVSAQGTDLTRCSDFRLQPASACAYRCLAREACPVGSEHRYSGEQIRYHYGCSLAFLQHWRGGG